MPKITYPQSAVSAQNQMRTPTDFLSPNRKADETASGSNFFNPSFGNPSPISNSTKQGTSQATAANMASVINTYTNLYLYRAW
jgi:hypothetical protein